jgi:uncharacterized protein involved in exopolysaccharide biosynthesis
MDMNVDPGRERSRLRDAVRYHPVLVALMSVMGLLLGLGLAALVPSPDTASTTVLLRPLPGNPYSSVNEPDTLVALETEAQLVRSDEVSRRVIRDLDLGVIREVRNSWQFYRDRRPDSYGPIVAP